MESERPAEPPVTESPPPSREPVFNAPILALLLAGSILGLYWLQSGPEDMALSYDYGLIPARMADGAYLGLVTHLLVHGGWTHAIMNAVGALAFAAPVARLMGGLKGLIGFLSLYIVCGVIAGGGYALLHLDGTVPLVGASGAVFGLIGAATRMLGGRATAGGRILPLTDRHVLTSAAAWIGVNVLIGVIGGVGNPPGMEGARIAWEAHVIGLIAGLLLIGPWARIFGRRPAVGQTVFDSPGHMRDSTSRSGPWGA
jgi:membrane associated rhomboid family serine protease